MGCQSFILFKMGMSNVHFIQDGVSIVHFIQDGDVKRSYYSFYSFCTGGLAGIRKPSLCGSQVIFHAVLEIALALAAAVSTAVATAAG